MKKVYSWEKLVFVVSAGVIVLLALLGFYLVKVKIPEPYGHLVKAAHSHGLCFAFAAIFYAFLLKKVNLSREWKELLAYGTLVTFLGPFGLLFAGLSHRMDFLTITAIIGDGAFVLLWIVLFFLLWVKFEEREGGECYGEK